MEDEFNKLYEKIEEAQRLVRKLNDTLIRTHYATIHDITKTFEAIYNALSKYYERVEIKEIPPEIYKEYVEVLRREIEQKMKSFENKYIPIEVVAKDEEGKTVTKKIYVNAKLFLDLVTEKFGMALWEHLAIRMVPPELIIMLLQHIEHLYNRVANLEVSLRYVAELLAVFTDSILMFDRAIKNFNNSLLDLQNNIQKISESISILNKKLKALKEKEK